MYSYARHQPENTLLYQVIEKYYPAFVAHLAAEGRPLPDYVHQEFEDYLKCGRLEHGFLRVRCQRVAVMNGWWRLAVSGAVFVQAVVQDEWWIARLY